MLDYQHPRQAQELRIVGSLEAVRGEKLLVRLVGEDVSPETDTALVHLASTKSDPKGFIVEAVETGPKTGVYVAVFEPAATTKADEAKIAAKTDGEKIIATWRPPVAQASSPDPVGAGMPALREVRAEKTYRDRVPPLPPTVTCVEQPRLCWDTFDRDLGQWRTLDEPFGAKPGLEQEHGNAFLRMRPAQLDKGHMGVSAWRKAYSLVEFPILSFDFRAPPNTQVDLLVYLTQPAVGWKGIRLTDDGPYHPRIGRFSGVKADGVWHRAEVNLLAAVQERFPSQKDYRVSQIVIGDWDGGERVFGTKTFGASARMGGSYDVDNFAILKYGEDAPWRGEGNKATIKWSAADDSGIVGYSFVLDKEPNTVPRTDESSASVPLAATGTVAPHSTATGTVALHSGAEKTYEGLTDGRWWFHVRAKDGCGNWSAASHYMLVIDTQPPQAEMKTSLDKPIPFGSDIQIALTDAGAGVDAVSLLLDVDGRVRKVHDLQLSYHPKSQTLTFSPHRMPPLTVVLSGPGKSLEVPHFTDYRRPPYPVWFVDGFPVSLKLAGVRDFAGHRMESEPTWRFIADSPILLSDGKLTERNGWCTDEPQVSLREQDRATYTLAWMRTLEGDKLAAAGAYIREIGLFRKPAQDRTASSAPIPVHDGKQQPVFVAEVKVDKTAPKTEIAVREEAQAEGGSGTTKSEIRSTKSETSSKKEISNVQNGLKDSAVSVPAPGGREVPQTIVTLSHSERAWRRGGLLGRYYRKDDFTDLLCERLDSFVYFSDDREQFTPVVPGAHSAIWTGALYAGQTEKVQLELAIWNRAPASGRALIDGELMFELLPKDMTIIGYKKREVLLTRGLHELRLEFREPGDRAWSFALFRWGKGERGEDTRVPFGPHELYYAENLGTTFYRWNDGPAQIYSKPFTAPKGKSILRFYTVDAAGHAEPEQRREFVLE
ncbi:MAG: hypothetical protein FJ279_08970 [Planctomycetes bacterium]|nr:hypothetical protein [Planctomycetota bacterium]MBM4078985.1 hypothetical protein [Planctomycetota bacterium]